MPDSLASKDFELISEADLQSLIATGVPEGIFLEYKRDVYGKSDADVKEFLKDISSFANTYGGHLIVGMSEASGLPVGLTPLSLVDIDAELLRLENIARDGLEPRISGLRFKAISLTSGGSVIVTRVPRSWKPPHRVNAKGASRIYGRNSAGAYEFSVEELRVVFGRSIETVDRIRAFRRERLSRIDANDGIVPLAMDLGRLVVHFFSIPSMATQDQINIEESYKHSQQLAPIAATSWTPQINFEGILCYRAGESCFGYTQLFREGVVEATKVRCMMERNGHLLIPSVDFARCVIHSLENYMVALQKSGVQPPIVMAITMQGVKGSILGVSNDQFMDRVLPLTHSNLELPEVVFERFGDLDYYLTRSRPAFDALWNSAGFVKCTFFDDNNLYVGQRR